MRLACAVLPDDNVQVLAESKVGVGKYRELVESQRLQQFIAPLGPPELRSSTADDRPLRERSFVLEGAVIRPIVDAAPLRSGR